MKQAKPCQTMPSYSILSNVFYFHRHAYREYPRLAFYHLVSVLGRILLPVSGILMPGLVLSMVEKGEWIPGMAVIALAGFSILLCQSLVQQVQSRMYFCENFFRTILLNEAVLKQMKCLYQYLEYDEQNNITRRDYQSLGGGDTAVSYRMLACPRDLIVNIACFFLYSTVLALLHPWLIALLLLLSVINYAILHIRNQWQLAFRQEFAQSDREIQYLLNAFSDKTLAKDVRVFAMNRWLLDFRGQIFQKRLRLEKKNNRRIFFTDFLQLLLNVLRNGLAYGYLIASCLQGHITPASFLVYFGAITGFSSFITGIVDTYSSLKLANADASCVRAHMDLPEIGEESPAPDALYRQPARIEFRDVSFSYGEKKIYDHFNLVIQPGEKIALLGVNGAGKTTLVKLLCGLYRPDAGSILINGVDLSDLQGSTLYRLFSVVFQDAAIFPYPMGTNISFQRAENTDYEQVWNALKDAGLEKIFREKQIDENSYMTRIAFEDGIELSGGQAQKFLLARALYKNGNILILDEPTSALDPIAESEIYQEYVKLARERTSLFISHRLASTRFSDRILFLENGKIKEEGTHEQLMALGGSYAHMFEVQSHYYKEESEDAGDVG